jgi:hypothetical protein
LPKQNVPAFNLIIPGVEFAPEKLDVRLEGSYQPVPVVWSGPVKCDKLSTLGRFRWQEHDPHAADLFAVQLTAIEALPDGIG